MNHLNYFKTLHDGLKETLEYNIKHIKGDTEYKRVAKRILKEMKES